MISLPSITDVKQQLYKTMCRFPLPAGFAAIITVVSIMLSHNLLSSTEEDWAIKILLCSILGLAAFTGLTLALETTTRLKRNLGFATGLILLALYGYFLPNDSDNPGSIWMMKHVFLCLTGIITLFWAPFWRQKVENNILWHWSSLLISSAVITFFFALVLLLGLMAALWSVDSLFNLDIDEEFYLDIWIIITALFGPLFWLSQFHPQPNRLKAPKTVPAFMGIFTKYIMTPLALGYLVILYAYTAKILITWEWPKNVLGWLVIAFLGVAIFTYFLWTPLLKPAFEKYRRIFWLLLIPQIFLLFMAIGWRIQAYSWTENRYFVVILGLWLLGTTLYFLCFKKARFKTIFVALTLIVFFSQIGPLSGYNIGKTSQTNRLMILLEEAKVKQGQLFTTAQTEIPTEIEDEIAEILDYLRRRFGPETLKATFKDLDYTDVERYELETFIMESYGLNFRTRWERRQNRNSGTVYQPKSFSTESNNPLNIEGYDRKISVSKNLQTALDNPVQNYAFLINDSNLSPLIEIYYNGQLVDTIEVQEKIERLFDYGTTSVDRDAISPEEASVLYESNELSAKVYLTSASQYNEEEIYFRAQILIGFKDVEKAKTYQQLSLEVEDEYLKAGLASASYVNQLLEPNFNTNYHLGYLRVRGVDVEFMYDFNTQSVVQVRYLTATSGTYQIQNFNLDSSIVQTCPYIGRDYSGPDLLPAPMFWPMEYQWNTETKSFVEVGKSEHECLDA